MKRAKFSAFDVADYLKTEEDIAAYLAAAGEEGDPKLLVAAMGAVVRARSVAKVAKEAGMTREGVYKAFSADGNPSFATVVKVARALDLGVSFQAKKSRAPSGGAKKTAPSGGRRGAAKDGSRGVKAS